jgi:pimeloyl-ACP methyl ester carboxylesterase
MVFLVTLSGCGLFMKGIPAGEMAGPTPFAEDHFIKAGGVNYHYAEYPAAGADILLIHGFGSSTFSWEKVAPILQKEGYHVWALDMKGFGWSDKPLKSKYDAFALTQGVKDWMDAVGLKKVIYAGNSLGGCVGVLMAMESPERIDRMILIDAGGYPMKMPLIIRLGQIPGSIALTKAFFGKWMLDWNLKEVFYHKDWLTQESIDAYYVRLTTPGSIDAQAGVIDALDFDAFDKYIKRIPEIKTPTLIIWGRDDIWIPLENGYKFRKDLANSVLSIIPECGHVPQEEYPDLTADLIIDYLDNKIIKDTVLRSVTQEPKP